VTNHSHRNGTNKVIGIGARSTRGSCSHVQAVRYTFYNMEGCAGYSLAFEGWQVVDPPSDSDSIGCRPSTRSVMVAAGVARGDLFQ
jgi:hypothetical protein